MAVLMLSGMMSLASLEAPTAQSSRMPLSRIADANSLQQLTAPKLSEENALLDCVPREVSCLRGGVAGKCDVVLVGCGVPKRGMGWYHAKQMLEGDVPSATLTAVVEPWFLGAGGDSPPGQTFKAWADEMEAAHGTKFVKDINELEIKVRAQLARARVPIPLQTMPVKGSERDAGSVQDSPSNPQCGGGVQATV